MITKQTARDTSGRWMKASVGLPSFEGDIRLEDYAIDNVSRWVIVKTNGFDDAPFDLRVCRWSNSKGYWLTDDDVMVVQDAEWCELDGSAPVNGVDYIYAAHDLHYTLTSTEDARRQAWFKANLGEPYQPQGRVICLVGRQGVGKSSVARHLTKKFGHTHDRLAGPIKDMLKVGLGLSHDHVDGSLKEKPCALLNGKTPRYAMQTLGTEWGRNIISQGLWTWACINRCKAAVKEGKTVIIDDVRFLSEAEMLKDELDAIFIKIERPIKRKFKFTDWLMRRGQYHQSEREADKIEAHRVITNTSTMERLFEFFEYQVPELLERTK